MSYNNNTLPRPGKSDKNEEEQQTPPNKTRPVSLYDNIHQDSNTPLSFDLSNDASPSQALCLSTTVPVNIARAPISGRHTPTRASLRHSRMLVLSQQTGRVPWKYLPPVVRWHRCASTLMFLLVLLGSVALVLAFYLALRAPFLTPVDLPFWSGALNVMSGMTGLLLVCWCRRLYPGVPGPEWVCEARQQYIALSIGLVVLASAASILACVFIVVRLIWLFQIECFAHILETVTAEQFRTDYENSTTFVTSLQENSTLSQCVCNSTDGAMYEGLACPANRTDILALILSSGAVHILAVVLTVGYLTIHWKSRKYGQPVYANVRYSSTPRLPVTPL